MLPRQLRCVRNPWSNRATFGAVFANTLPVEPSAQRSGIDAALRTAGVAPGDSVRIGSLELEWEREAWEQPR